LNEFCVKRLDEKLDHAEFGSSKWKWSMWKCQGCQKNQYKVVHENLLLCTQTSNHQLDLTWKWFWQTCCFISRLDSCCQSSKCNFWSVTGTLLHWEFYKAYMQLFLCTSTIVGWVFTDLACSHIHEIIK
jgi:hypothetical protein